MPIVLGGRIVAASGQAIGKLDLQVWGHDISHLFVTTSTDSNGEFRTAVGEESIVLTTFGDRARVLEFKVFRDGQPLTITEGATLPIKSATLKTVIKVKLPAVVAPQPPVSTDPATRPPVTPPVKDAPPGEPLTLFGTVCNDVGDP